jgi:hypothetical protein
VRSSFSVIPPTLDTLRIPRHILRQTQALLTGPGERGFEAVVLWLGYVISETEAHVEVAYFPRQVTYKTEGGLAVEIPVEEWTQLALALPRGTFVLAKIHTHGSEAYHSETDASNPYLNHEAAISIVVPFFARGPFEHLEHCSVNVFQAGQWIELTPNEIQRRFIVVEVGAADHGQHG